MSRATNNPFLLGYPFFWGGSSFFQIPWPPRNGENGAQFEADLGARQPDKTVATASGSVGGFPLSELLVFHGFQHPQTEAAPRVNGIPTW